MIATTLPAPQDATAAMYGAETLYPAPVEQRVLEMAVGIEGRPFFAARTLAEFQERDGQVRVIGQHSLQ